MNKVNYWLEEFDAISIDGKDSKRFLNGLTTSNMNLQTEVVQTCLLSPKGILKAILEIYFYENHIVVIALEGNLYEIKKFFEDMIFPTDEISLSDIFRNFRIQEINESTSWREGSPELIRQEKINDFLKKGNFEIIDQISLKEWKILQAIPTLNNEIEGTYNPLELGLLDIVDFNKGCYLGQEIMARFRKLSSLKQEIRVWNGSLSEGNKICKNKKIYSNKLKDIVVGYVTSYFLSENVKVTGLAIIKNKYLEQQFFYLEDFGEIKIKKSIGSIFF
tara:strand:+ start:1 stop:828 length:828 start_codon:yes stop_codon:yes gene_type:complete